MTNEIVVKVISLSLFKIKNDDFVSISDMIKAKDGNHFISDWLKNTRDEIKKYSDREIIVSNKFDKKKASDYFDETFVLVTYHSNAGIDAMINGIPCIFTNQQRQFSKISEIENPPYSENILYNLAYWQWNVHEMKSGEAWSFLTKKNNNY
jgi:hypothetical protein